MQLTTHDNVDMPAVHGVTIQKERNDQRVSIIIPHSSTCLENGSREESKASGLVLTTVKEYVSIYKIHGPLKRSLILATASIMAFLLTFSDTVYLPSLNAAKTTFHTSDILVTLSVSIYLFTSGILSLLWGPLSDRLGRKITIVVALIIFLAASIACALASNIIILIVFRAVQGAAISAAMVVGRAVVADIYPVESRGWGTGIFYLTVLIGPIIGPLVGGATAGAFGWQSTFIMLSILSLLILVVVFVCVPETHQYFVRVQFEKSNPNKYIIDATPEEKPVFQKPWKPITLLFDMAIAPYILLANLTFSGLFISLTVFSNHLHDPPYSYGETTIGILFVPCGVIMLFGSLLGGWLSDRARKYYADMKCSEGCLVPTLAFSILGPIGLVIYGWTFHYRLHLAGPIMGQILLGLAYSVLAPGMSAYLSAKKQEQAAALSAVGNFLECLISSIFVTLTVPLSNVIGTGPLFSLICGINVIAIFLVSMLVFKSIRRANSSSKQQNVIAFDRKTLEIRLCQS